MHIYTHIYTCPFNCLGYKHPITSVILASVPYDVDTILMTAPKLHQQTGDISLQILDMMAKEMIAMIAAGKCPASAQLNLFVCCFTS